MFFKLRFYAGNSLETFQKLVIDTLLVKLQIFYIFSYLCSFLSNRMRWHESDVFHERHIQSSIALWKVWILLYEKLQQMPRRKHKKWNLRQFERSCDGLQQSQLSCWWACNKTSCSHQMCANLLPKKSTLLNNNLIFFEVLAGLICGIFKVTKFGRFFDRTVKVKVNTWCVIRIKRNSKLLYYYLLRTFYLEFFFF